MGNNRYNAGARMLHWAIAVLILANLATGLLHDALEGVVAVMPVHKAVGLTVLVLSLARLGWRMCWKAPAYPGSMSGTEIAAAHILHALLYVLMIAMPLSGWIMSSAGKYPLSWFGLFDWPKLAVTKGSTLYEIGHSFHGIGGWTLLALVLGHVAAALRHQFLLRDAVLRRML
ncbi:MULTISPECIES: cytochrome b [unclassified Novosphingobium]|uniref:cytochrome b n=1 Tax=unclassified Novosphingobium TaxID=2644732 RepID=UPI001357C47F|nr:MULTISPECIES: cytochrome b [unclassified Novosphingobium]